MAETTGLEIQKLPANPTEGDVQVNAAFDLIDAATQQVLTINFTSDADLTLTTTGTIAQWQYGYIRLTDTGPVLTAARNVIVPNNQKRYIYWNDTAQTLTVKTSAGTGIELEADEVFEVQCDGTDVISADGGGGVDNDTTYTVSAETDASGANLRLTGSDASTDDVLFAEGTGVTITRTDANTITIAATAAASVLDMPVQEKTADYTLVTGDQGNLINVDATSAPVTITLQAAASAGDGYTIVIKKVDGVANDVTIDANGAETIDGSATKTISNQYDAFILACDGTEWHVLAEPATGATDADAIHDNVANEITAITEKTTLDPDDEFLIEDSEASYVKKSITATTIQKVEENAQTGTSYTLVIDDAFKLVTMENGSANTMTVPPNSSVAFTIGTQVLVSQLGAGQTTIVAGSGVTIRTASTLLLRAQYSSISLIKIATDEWLLAGDTE